MESTTVRGRFISSAFVGAVVAAIPFLWSLTAGRPTLLRTARPDGLFSNFFDLQAEALLDGRFQLPLGALGIESFIVDGRTYTYFPPFPALLRMPILAVWKSAAGHLTALSMLTAWCLMLVGAVALLWEARRLAGLTKSISSLGCALTALFVISLGGGSVVVFLASTPWVFHEVYFWSIALSILASWAAVRLVQQPTWRRGVDLTVLISACILTRTTAGFGCVAIALACAVLLRRRTDDRGARAWPIAVTAAAVPLALACTVTWIKFGSPFNFLPLDAQVWTQVNEQRRRALAANGGGLTNVNFFPTTLSAYFDPRGIRFVDWYPFVTLPSRPPSVVGNAYFDQTYRTGSVTSFMPGLFVAAVVGSVSALRRVRSSPTLMLVPLTGTAVTMLGVLNYGYMANRYVGDLTPFLTVGAVIGAVVIERCCSGRRLGRIVVLITASFTTMWGVVANSLVAHAASARTAEGDQLRSFISDQLRWSPSTASLVTLADEIPTAGVADALTVVRSCSLLLMATGEKEAPWIVAGGNQQRASIDVPNEGTVPLFTFTDSGIGAIFIALESSSEGVRLVASGALTRVSGWTPYPVDRTSDLRVDLNPDSTNWVVSLDNASILRVAAVRFDVDWIQQYAFPSELGRDERVTWGEPDRDPLCARVMSAAINQVAE